MTAGRWGGVAAAGLLAAACNGTTTGGGGSGQALAYCQKVYAEELACGIIASSACESALVSECADELSAGNLLSPTAVGLVAQCNPPVTGGTCATDAALADEQAYEQCLDGELAAAPTTAAASKLKSDFCAVCPDGASRIDPTSCSGFFSGTDAGAGVGLEVKLYADSLVDAMDAQCTGSALATSDAGGTSTDCFERFEECVSHVAETAEESFEPDAAPAACADAGGADAK